MASRAGRWKTLFGARQSEQFGGKVVVDVGCFDGTFLTRVAQKHPDVGFVGVDWTAKSLVLAAGNAERQGAPNAQFVHGRAQDIGKMFEAGEVAEVWLFQPEPVDSGRKEGHRLMTGAFLTSLGRVLAERGRLCVKTDDRAYYECVLELMEKGWVVTEKSNDFWGDGGLQERVKGELFAGEKTPYEARFTAKRKAIFYIAATPTTKH